MRDDGARWALVAFPPIDKRPVMLIISEDAIPAATSRKWIVLGKDSDIYAPDDPIIISGPRRVVDDD